MAKAILEYDLDNPDDNQAHYRAVRSLDMAGALWDITHNTKKGLEWAMEGKELNKYEALDMVFDKIFEILEEHDINTDKLY
jgi:hypothetical protein